MLKMCGVIGPGLSRYSLKENIQKLKEVAREISQNWKGLNLFTSLSQVLNYASEEETRFELFSRYDASSDKQLNYMRETIMRERSKKENYTLKKTGKALNSLASHIDITEVKVSSGQRKAFANSKKKPKKKLWRNFQ